ncbi:MAG TPA: xanthine dehydrogenase family protein subunit M [Myxococcota bacterium]|nr:xanthine dehydrogenase family protein subunit M [Myxococcota bacterium]
MINFIKLESLDDVLEMIWADGPTALLLAGGTDILVRPESFAGRRMLIDISKVAELRGIGLTDQGLIRVGAAVTHQAIADNALIRRRARLLSLACRAVGSVQIRNLGTIGGNLGNASPAADSLPALVCLDARVALAARGRRRVLPVLSFLKGPARTDLGLDEVIEAVLFSPRRGRTVAFFKKAGQRKGMCCSKASLALCARRHGDGRLSHVRVAMGAVAPTVIGVPQAEEILEGRVLDAERVRSAAKACIAAVRAIDDIRSSADYRRRVVGALMTEGLIEIIDHTRKLAGRRKRKRRP